MAEDNMLTTIDNPYSPWTDWDRWKTWDEEAGYHTLALLGRIIITSDELSEADEAQAYDMAMNEIISENVSGMHTKSPSPERTS